MLVCETVVKDFGQRKNLCDCLRILGETPEVEGDKVSVTCQGKQHRLVVEVFRQYQGSVVRFVDY